MMAGPMTANGCVIGAVLLRGPSFNSACTMDMEMSARGISVVVKVTWAHKSSLFELVSSSGFVRLLQMRSVPLIADAGPYVSGGASSVFFASASAPILYGAKSFRVPIWIPR